jgi:hypothetical protein
VLTGYDYPNKDLLPDFVYPIPSGQPESQKNYLQRVIQGSRWFYNSGEDMGTFDNLLVPHYPAKDTSKYGVGLQLFDINFY